MYIHIQHIKILQTLKEAAEEAGNGEVRGDFGDTACFETVTTNSKGIAQVTFTLPDNVTTYTATAHSANKDLYVGVNTLDIVSKLDFFIQSTEPRNVKTTDDLVLNATSIAEDKYKDCCRRCEILAPGP